MHKTKKHIIADAFFCLAGPTGHLTRLRQLADPL